MKRVLLLSLIGFAFGTANAQYKLSNKVDVGSDYKWDYLAYDAGNQNIYVSNSKQTLVVSTASKKLVATIPHTLGVHGIAIDNSKNAGFISNGKGNSIYKFDLKTYKVTDTIGTKGQNPDAILYDSFSGNVFAFNGKTNNANVFSTDKLNLVADIVLPGKPEFGVSDGKGNVFVNLEDAHKIVQINTKTNKVEGSFDIAPGEEPSGLALDAKNGLLFSVCSNKKMMVFDIKAKKVVKTLVIGGDPDAVVFDPETRNIFVSNSDGTLDIFHQTAPLNYTKTQTLTTPAHSKTLGYDSANKELYVPTANFDGKKVASKSFNINVYSSK